MEESNLLSINVWLSGRSYRIRIKPEEEEAVRKAVKVADDKITELRNQYAGKDDQDFLAMCLLTYATDAATEGHTNNPVLSNELQHLINRIEKAVQE